MTKTQTDTAIPTETLYRTAAGIRTHLRGCSHIVGLEVTPVADGDTSIPVCRWTRTELEGKGRIPQKTVDGALRELGANPVARPKLVKLLKGVKWDSVYLPQSRSYVALTLEGRAVAWAGRNYAQIGDEFLPLPEYQGGSGGGPFVSELWGEPCEQCFQERARNGTCSCG